MAAKEENTVNKENEADAPPAKPRPKRRTNDEGKKTATDLARERKQREGPQPYKPQFGAGISKRHCCDTNLLCTIL